MSDMAKIPGRAMNTLALAAALLLFLGCGARMGPRGQSDGGNGPKGDGVVLRDRGVPKDLGKKDSCLPIPASAVEGSYKGEWKGTTSCTGFPFTDLRGTLSFNLKPTGATSFTVRGEMTGTATGGPGSPGVPFKATVSGSMGCTALSAQLQIDIIGNKLSGTMVGTFGASPVGFESGSWKVPSPPNTCPANGTWNAVQ